MTTPPHDGAVLTSSPISIRGNSPARRRSGSSEDFNDLSSRARHSPTRVRSSFDPNDPQVRERQRTMDVDMAMQLSRARRETLHMSPTTPATPYDPTHPLPHPPQPPLEHGFPGLSVLPPHPEHEAEEVPEMSLDDIVSDETSIPRHQPSIDNLQHLNQTHDPSLLVSLAQSGPPLPNEDRSVLNYGLPTYQANATHSSFDFSRMEEFAVTEKQRLGLASPTVTRFTSGAFRGRASTTEASAPAPGEDAQPESGPSEPTLQRLRHRKLSTSNPNPRHRKGIGGKMALFESTSGEAPSGRLGFVLSGQAEGSSDNITGVPGSSGIPSGGILSTGHDRPYRFSFYSNSLSATIHARSLSELPAEGQTFEQLFSGINPPNGVPLDRFTEPPRNSFFTPPDLPSRASPGPAGLGGPPPNFAEATSSNGVNMNRRSFGVDAKMGQSTSDIDDSNTWWLDIQNPVDEEMKMLSKVNVSSLHFCATLLISQKFCFSPPPLFD